jgi:ATP-dependent Clp protease protease subunit
MIKKAKRKITDGIVKEVIQQVMERITIAHDAMKQSAPPGPDRDVKLRTVGLMGDVGEEQVAELVHGILYLNETNRGLEREHRKPIKFYISTYGGSADDMFALYDVMKEIQKETDIYTIGLGKVMSAGVLLLASGTPGRRLIGRNCRIMVHSVQAGNHGNLFDLVNELEAIEALQDMYIEALVQNTKMTNIQLKKMLKQKVNVYLTAEEAVELGIADEIL